MKRRHFLGSVLGGALLPVTASNAAENAASVSFKHGVASGDPTADAVVIWTRVSGCANDFGEVRWKVASDPAMQKVLKRGRARTGVFRDYTVKVDVTGLPSGAELFYQFEADSCDNTAVQSPVGRTRTLPTSTLAAARFAVVSCANYPYGYFHVYREIANRDDLDAVIHLGDYLYEYGMGEYATERAEELGRVPEPAGETVSLADLRTRHAQYKTDPDLQALHAAHPLIAVWDDHELANNAWRDGAQNHQGEEGDWPSRRDAAIQAWLEWMPVRVNHEQGHTRIYRKFDYGDLLSLVMLDTRLVGRDLQPDEGPGVTAESVGAAMRDPKRRLLGARQESWLRETLVSSKATWQVLGQQVMMLPALSPDLEPLLDLALDSMVPIEQLQQYIALSKNNPPMILDTWNGYPVARQQLLAELAEYARNPIVLSGDLHTSMAGDLYLNGRDKPVSVEFMTGSVSSPGFAEYLPEKRPGAVRDATLAINPMMKYIETDRRGWLLLSLTPERCLGEWHLLNSVHTKAYTVSIDKRLFVRAGHVSDGLQEG